MSRHPYRLHGVETKCECQLFSFSYKIPIRTTRHNQRATASPGSSMFVRSLVSKSTASLLTLTSLAYYSTTDSRPASTSPSSTTAFPISHHHILGKTSTDDVIYDNKRVKQFTHRSSHGLSMSSYPANKPTEDRAAIARATIHDSSFTATTATTATTAPTPSTTTTTTTTTTTGNEDLNVYCVFDGHGGYQVADYAAEMLIPHLVTALSDSHPSTATTPDYVDATVAPTVRFTASLIQAFRRVERELTGALRPAFDLGFGNVARVGACALVAVLKDDQLWVANAGDCRAVLGSVDASQNNAITTTLLSTEHNVKNATEQDRLKEMHPDEMIAGLLRCKSETSCYVKGNLQPSRSLGDLYLKYTEFRPGFDQNSALLPYTSKDPARARRVRSPFSPPYVLSDPEVQHATLTEQDGFLILASDGLWDEMSPEESVCHLYEWEKKNQARKERKRRERNAAASGGGVGVGAGAGVVVAGGGSGKMEVGQSASEYLVEKALEHAALEAGQTLEEVRNIALGKRRHIHDDITVIVVDLKTRRVQKSRHQSVL